MGRQIEKVAAAHKSNFRFAEAELVGWSDSFEISMFGDEAWSCYKLSVVSHVCLPPWKVEFPDFARSSPVVGDNWSMKTFSVLKLTNGDLWRLPAIVTF